MEVNERFISVVQLRRDRKGPVLGGFAREQLPPGTVTAAGVANAKQFHASVIGALQAAKAGRVNVCMSVTGDLVDIRNLQLPPVPRGEMERAVRWELKQWVSFAKGADDDLILDFALLDHPEPTPAAGLSAEGPRGTVDVVAVSAPRRFVYGFLTPLHNNRVFPEIMDIAGFSLPWAVPKPGGVGYIHLGPGFIQIMFVDNGSYRLSRQVPVNLAAVLDSPDLPRLDQAYASMDPDEDGTAKVLRDVIISVNQTLEHFRVQMRVYDVAELIGSLIVSGDGALLPGMIALIERETGLPTGPALPVIGPQSDSLPESEAPAYAVAVGLAQRGLADL